LQEFFQYLRTDPKFFYKTPDELLNAYRAITRRIDPELVKVFRTLPRTPYGVIPIPDKIAPDTTTAYYNSPSADGSRPGLLLRQSIQTRNAPEMGNDGALDSRSRSRTSFAARFAAGTRRSAELQQIRRLHGFYRRLGLIFRIFRRRNGLYTDPYDKFGQLTYEMWRAVRLVVDTGMHYFKWDRQRAIDFFKDNAAKTEQDIVNEIDRYISDPGTGA
jgi:uncharacterized protein (DUF885 family)